MVCTLVPSIILVLQRPKGQVKPAEPLEQAEPVEAAASQPAGAFVAVIRVDASLILPCK